MGCNEPQADLLLERSTSTQMNNPIHYGLRSCGDCRPEFSSIVTQAYHHDLYFACRCAGKLSVMQRKRTEVLMITDRRVKASALHRHLCGCEG
jgi:DNA-directed RNA polymerase subunit RPC12/RpoP